MRRPQDDISKLFQESLDSYTPEVPSDLWKGVEEGVKNGANAAQSASGLNASNSSGLALKVIATSFAIAGSIAGFIYIADTGEPKEQQLKEAQYKQATQELVKDKNTPLITKEEVSQNDRASQVNGSDQSDESIETRSNQEGLLVDHALQVPVQTGISGDSKVEVSNDQESSNTEVNAADASKKAANNTSEKPIIEQKIEVVQLNLSAQEGEAPFNLGIKTSCKVKNCLFELRTPEGVVIKAPTADTSITLTEPGTYQVSMVSRCTNGELHTQSKYVTVKAQKVEEPQEAVIADLPVDIIKVFSPNGDNMNDVMEIPTPGIQVKRFEWVVFDRSGRTVMKTNNPRYQWDGTDDNQMVPEGTYFYYVTVYDTEGNVFMKRGNVMISR